MDIYGHRSTDICKVDFESCKKLKIVCMEDWHASTVLKTSVRSGIEEITEENVTQLDDINNTNVYDPVGSPRKTYERVFNFIRPHVERHVREFAASVGEEVN